MSGVGSSEIVAHELRSPLGAVASAIHALDRLGTPDEPAAAFRHIIRGEVGPVARVVTEAVTASG